MSLVILILLTLFLITNTFNYFSFTFDSQANMLDEVQTKMGLNKLKLKQIQSKDYGDTSSKVLIKQTMTCFKSLSRRINNNCEFNGTSDESYKLLREISFSYLIILSLQSQCFP